MNVHNIQLRLIIEHAFSVVFIVVSVCYKLIFEMKYFLIHFIVFAVYSTGEFLFAGMGADTYVIEMVSYQCPPFFGPVCRREVEFQRKAIMNNLSAHFNKK